MNSTNSAREASMEIRTMEGPSAAKGSPLFPVPWRRGWWTAAAVVLACSLVVSACGERSPLGLEPEIEVPEDPAFTFDSLGGVFHSSALITCDVTMSPLAISCGSTQAPAGTTPAIGGRGNHVRLQATALNYNPDTQVLRMNVAFQNYLVNQIGAISDGTVTGLTPFFTTLFRTGGSGGVSLLNADGTGTFTEPNQPYYHYPEKLALQETSATRQWRFSVSPTVTSLRFRVYVSAHLMPVVVFDAVTGGNRDIWRVAPDGSDLVRLTSASTEEMEPTASRNLVIFTRYIGGKGSLWSVPLSGGPMEQVLSLPENLGSPALHPDGGARLAFTKEDHGVTRIWWRFHPTGQPRRPNGSTPHPGAIEASPKWHPTLDNQVAFVSTHRPTPGIFRARTISSTGGTIPVVDTTSTDVDFTYPHLQGNRIAFSSNRRAGFADIYVLQFNTGAVTAISARDLPDVQPTFLSDGNLLYLSYRPAPRFRFYDLTAGSGVLVPNVPGTMQPRNPYGVPLYR